jgi:glycosidase
MDSNDDFYGIDAVMSTFVGNHDLPRSIHLADDTPLWSDPYTDGKDHAWDSPPIAAPSHRSAYERLANAIAIILTNKGAPLLYYGDEIGLPGAGDPDNRRMMQFDSLDANQSWLQAQVKTLLAIRAAHPSMRHGKRSTLSVDADLWVFQTTTSYPTTDTVIVAVNRGDTDRSASGLPASWSELVTGTTGAGATTVPARQTRIFVAK